MGNNQDRDTVAIMGCTGSGKTTFVNLVSGSTLRVGDGLESCTTKVQISRPFELNNRHVELIDTPGFDDTTKSDADILNMIATYLCDTYREGKKLAGVIYLHRISDFRFGGVATRNFKMFRELCGETTLKNVVIVTTMWSEVAAAKGAARETELATNTKFFKSAIDKQALLLRHDNTLSSAQRILSHIIHNQPLSLRIQEEVVTEGKDISQTAAGEELGRELAAQTRKFQAEMSALQAQTNAAIREKDEETRKELEEERLNLRNQMNKAQMDMNKLMSNFKADNQQMERRLKSMEEEHERDRAYLERQLVEATARVEREAAARAKQQAAANREAAATRANREAAAANARAEQDAAATRLNQLRYPVCQTTIYPYWGPWGPGYTWTQNYYYQQ